MFRLLAAIVFVLLVPASAWAQAPGVITDANGQPLGHPTITKFDGTTFTVEHDGGIAHVPWEQVPPALRAGYDFDPERARDAKNKETLQLLNIRRIKELQTDVPSFVGKRFSIQGTIDVSSYYNWGYQGAQTTHYSFQIKDGTGTCHAFMPKAQAEQLRATILSEAATKKEPQTFVCTIIPSRRSQYSELMLEILAYGPDTNALVRAVGR